MVSCLVFEFCVLILVVCFLTLPSHDWLDCHVNHFDNMASLSDQAKIRELFNKMTLGVVRTLGKLNIKF